jgi:crotonobetainyl-CoA:carnitine CoA-transferase CaiB-like acyl-CoA transferase
MGMLGVPINFSTMPSRVQKPAPILGKHTEEILHSLGYTPDQVVQLKRAKVI